MKLQRTVLRALALAVGVAAVAVAAIGRSAASAAAGTAAGSTCIGVSNTLVGNGWREEMICAVKAQALASGKVSKVIVSNQNGDAAEQIADIRNLISPGVERDHHQPGRRHRANPVIAQASGAASGRRRSTRPSPRPRPTSSRTTRRSTATSAPSGCSRRWAARATCSTCAASPARPPTPTATRASSRRSRSTRTSRSSRRPSPAGSFAHGRAAGARQIASGTKFDGIWTSGIDYSDRQRASRRPARRCSPVVGADNNGFIGSCSTARPAPR